MGGSFTQQLHMFPALASAVTHDRVDAILRAEGSLSSEALAAIADADYDLDSLPGDVSEADRIALAAHLPLSLPRLRCCPWEADRPAAAAVAEPGAAEISGAGPAPAFAGAAEPGQRRGTLRRQAELVWGVVDAAEGQLVVASCAPMCTLDSSTNTWTGDLSLDLSS